MLLAIFAALSAGGSFAAAGVLQQHVASTRPEEEALSLRLLADLARQPLWLLGIGLAFLSYVFESVALAFGPLVLVQPLIVSELLFALPISVRWRGMRMSAREWLGTASVAAGLCIGLVSASPGQGRPGAPLSQWALALAAMAAVALVAVSVGRSVTGPARASLFAVAAAAVLGTQAALLKAAIARFELGLVPALESWQLWAMVAASILGLLLVQSAYEAGPLAASMPVVDATDPAIGIGFGVVLFNEHVRTGSWLFGVLGGLALLFTGIALLDTSPLIHCLQEVERRQRTEPATAAVEPPERRVAGGDVPGLVARTDADRGP